jgi:hypothetical protein
MKKIILLLSAAFLVLPSCRKTDTSGVADFDEIAFTTRAAEAETRGATEVVTNTLTTFHVAATTGTSSQTKVWDNGVFSGTPGGTFTGGKFWPSESVSWNFYAANSQIAFAASGSTVTVKNCNEDIVADYLEGATYKASNALTFKHILSQIGTVRMKAPEGYAVTGLKVTVKPVCSGTYNLKKIAGSTPAAKAEGWTRGSASADVYLVGSAAAGVTLPAYPDSYVSSDNDLWLLPGQYQLTASYTITKGDYTENAVKHATVTLLQGFNNNLGLPGSNADEPNIPVPDDIADILFTVTVTPWESTEIPASFN